MFVYVSTCTLHASIKDFSEHCFDVPMKLVPILY